MFLRQLRERENRGRRALIIKPFLVARTVPLSVSQMLSLLMYAPHHNIAPHHLIIAVINLQLSLCSPCCPSWKIGHPW